MPLIFAKIQEEGELYILLNPALRPFACPMVWSDGRISFALFAVKFYRKGNTKFYALLNDRQIGQAKIAEKIHPCYIPAISFATAINEG